MARRRNPSGIMRTLGYDPRGRTGLPGFDAPAPSLTLKQKLTYEAGDGLGVIINPKTFEPCLPFKVKDKHKTFAFYTPDTKNTGDVFRVMGRGYFDDANGDAYDTSSSGYPRVHTPDGVRVLRKGYGTVLYTTLCLAATLEEMGELTIKDIEPSARGISSNSERSNSAKAWWKQARELGLTFQTSYSRTSDEPGTTEVSNDYRDSLGSRPGLYSAGRDLWDAARSYVAGMNGEDEGDLADMDIDISSTFVKEIENDEEEEDIADIYPFDSEGGAKGASIFVPFYGVSTFMNVEDGHIGDFYFDEKIFSTILLTGCDPHVVRFIRDLTKLIGKPTLFEEIVTVTLLNKRAIDIAEETDGTERYADLRPNPSQPASKAAKEAFHGSLSKEERKLLVKRSETIQELGLDKLIIDD